MCFYRLSVLLQSSSAIRQLVSYAKEGLHASSDESNNPYSLAIELLSELASRSHYADVVFDPDTQEIFSSLKFEAEDKGHAGMVDSAVKVHELVYPFRMLLNSQHLTHLARAGIPIALCASR